MTMPIMTNTHPADELAEVRDRIRDLKAREGELRDLLIDGRVSLVGATHVAEVRQVVREAVDTKAALKELGAQVLRPFMKKAVSTYVALKVRDDASEGEF